MEIDVKRQEQAREYAKITDRLMFINMGLSALGVLILLFSGLGTWLRDRLQTLSWQPVTGWFPVQILVYVLILLLIAQILDIPMSYYRGFVLSHRYGLSTMTLGSWIADLLKGAALSLVFEVLLVEIIYALLAFQPLAWWLWVAIGLLFFTVIMANLAPVLLMPIFYKFTPLPEGELTERLKALADRAGASIRGVFTMHLSDKTTAANAAVMGLGNTRRIVLGDTMVDRYSVDEIEVVLAHELGHHVHRDMWKMIVSQSVLMLAGLYLINLVMHWAVDTQHYYRSLADVATLPLLVTLSFVFGLIVQPLSNTYSRHMEYQADEYALQSTGKIEAFKSAMTRLANQNLTEVEPSPLMEALFHDHPAMGKRLQHADHFAD